MALGIDTERIQKERARAMTKIDRRLWVAEDGKTLVEDGDPKAAFLWAAGPGEEKSAEECERVGYKPDAKKAAEAVERASDERVPDMGQYDAQSKAAEAPEDKKAEKPADKSADKPKTKGA